MPYLMCQCGWDGLAEELESKSYAIEDTDYSYCPQCGRHVDEMEEEDEGD